MEVDEGEKDWPHVELHSVGYANVTNGTAGADPLVQDLNQGSVTTVCKLRTDGGIGTGTRVWEPY